MLTQTSISTLPCFLQEYTCRSSCSGASASNRTAAQSVEILTQSLRCTRQRLPLIKPSLSLSPRTEVGCLTRSFLPAHKVKVRTPSQSSSRVVPLFLGQRRQGLSPCQAAGAGRTETRVVSATVTLGPDTKEQKAQLRQSSTAAEAAATSLAPGSDLLPPTSSTSAIKPLQLLESEDATPASPGGIFGFLKSKLSPRVRGLVLLNILTFLYGSNVTVVKEAQSNIDPFSFSFGRFTLAALAFAPFLEKSLKSPPIRRAGIELGIWASLAYVTQSVGLMTTEAGRASFIGTFTVIEVPIIAGFFGAKIPAVTWWSAAAAVLGVGLLESGGNSTPMGDFWTIMSALIFGFHMLRSEHHARHVPEDGALSLIALQLLVTSVMSLFWLVGMTNLGLVDSNTVDALTGMDFTAFSHWPWWQMAYTGVLSTAFCLWVEVVSLRDVSATEAAMVYTLEPLYGAAFAWFLLGERWGPLGWIGAGLILGGSLTMQLLGRVEVAEDEPEEIEAQKSSAAILGALAAAAAIAMVMVASGGVPEVAAETLVADSLVVESLASADMIAFVGGASEAEIENLVTFMRAYAMVKGDHAAHGEPSEDGLHWL